MLIKNTLLMQQKKGNTLGQPPPRRAWAEKSPGNEVAIKAVVFTLLYYRSSKTKKLIEATLNGTMYMNGVELKSPNIMIVCVKVFNYILAVMSGLETSHHAQTF